MKNAIKILLLLLLLSVACRKQAQTPGEGFLFTDFEPNMEINEGTNHTDTIKMDFDRDGSPDFIAYYRRYSMGSRYFYVEPTRSNWEMGEWTDEMDNMTNPLIRWWDCTSLLSPYTTYGNDFFCVRCQVGDDFYYGWMQLYCINELASGGRYYLVLDKMLFCTIPNYPLRWGQTNLGSGVEETEAAAFAFVHPNPTNGLVTITGEGLRHADAVNVLGQRVATATSEGNQLTIDLGGLPSGIYFVNVTDETGHNCVRKVVKE